MTDVKNDEHVELNLDQKVTVKSIAGWQTGFRSIDGKDIAISPEGSVRLTRNEIISQVQNNNRLFNGVDGYGSHATLFVDDALTRKEVGFDSEDGTKKQSVLTDTVITNLFKLKSQNDFEARFKEAIVTRAEKYAVIRAVQRLGINDYSKIRFAEDYTGYRVQ